MKDIKHRENSKRMAVVKVIKPEGSCAFDIGAASEMSQTMVSKILYNLVSLGVVLKVKEKGIDRVFRYVLANASMVVAGEQTQWKHQTAKLLVTNAGDMWHRLSMLKKLRDRLIEDHHPLLNAVIADYEYALHSLRAGEDV